MPIIINEFEIITEAAPGPAEQTSPTPSQAQMPTLRPEDVQRILSHHQQRMERVRAD
jgi:hypothetical protein